MVTSDMLIDALAPVLADLGLDLFDLELRSRELCVFVERPGGIGLDDLARANAAVSRCLDELDPIEGRYTLEVSSPGLERRLRTPAHFAGALGEEVSVRTLPGSPVRRLRGRLAAVEADGIVIEGPELADGSARVSFDEIERAKTVFEWGPPPRPGSGASRSRRASGSGPAAGDPAGETERASAP